MAAQPYLVGVVDDDGSVRMALCSLLRSLGYRAVVFASAEEFLAAKTETLDCLVCDINMPGMTGWELLAWMEVKGLAVPTILITAFEEGISNGLSVPGVRVLKKPFSVDMMAEAIEVAIALRD